MDRHPRNHVGKDGQNEHLNKICARRLDEIEDFRFDVKLLPGRRNPTDPLSRRGFADGGDGPAASTGDPTRVGQRVSRASVVTRQQRRCVRPSVSVGRTLEAPSATFTNVQLAFANPSTPLRARGWGGRVCDPRT